MDERVEIIDVPQPLQSHPGEEAVRPDTKAEPEALYYHDGWGRAGNRPVSKYSRAWRIAALFFTFFAVISFMLGTGITPLGYAFANNYPLFLGWLGLGFIVAAISCGATAITIKEGYTKRIIVGVALVALGVSIIIVIFMLAIGAAFATLMT